MWPASCKHAMPVHGSLSLSSEKQINWMPPWPQAAVIMRDINDSLLFTVRLKRILYNYN